ncbi:hypothetical protein [Thalassotalea euphylliae]|uniref:Uncharacterized protein n=1 Tax=Thalassotalea euphylliae TaxID=1655234 RepID=A0A3E0UCF5_9GAMM|nr:hypothetical protein [Thalassotalea euphylliae]REL34691.1 hypothetical protein DXX92_04590 [Thalassotalea euphylliae]
MIKNNIIHQSIEQQLKLGVEDKETCYEHTSIANLSSSFVAHREDWQAKSFADSALGEVPALAGYLKNKAQVIELHHPDKSVGCLGTIVFAEDAATYFGIDYINNNDTSRFETFALATTDSFGDYYPNYCLNALLACQIAIEASTKLPLTLKHEVTWQIERDHAFVWQFIKQVICLPNNEQDSELLAQIKPVTLALINNSKFYWRYLEDHKATDFNFNISK